MQKSKIIPFRVMNSSNSDEAKLLVTSRRETILRVPPKIIRASSKPVQYVKLEGFRSPESTRFQASLTKKLETLSPKLHNSHLQLFKPVPTSRPSLNSAISEDNLNRLKNLNWEIKPVESEESQQDARRQTIMMDTMNPAILPKIYSLRPFLMPFLNGTKHSDGQIQVKSPGSEKKVYWMVRDTWGDRPNGREGCQLVAIRNVVYIFGGQSRIKHNEVRSLDVNIWTWRIMQSEYTPPGKLGHSLVPYKGKIVLYGGESQHSQNLGIRRCSRKIYYLSIKSKTWQHYSGEGEKPEGRRHHCSSHVGRFMVIYGGMNQQGHTLSDLYIFDMKPKKWILPEVTIQSDPGPRSHASFTGIFDQSILENYNEPIFKVAASKGKVEFLNSGFYLFGGRNADGEILNTLHGLYMREGKLLWTLIQNFNGEPPLPRYNHAASAIRNRLFIFGGRNDGLFRSSGESSLEDLHCFNVSSLFWESLKIGGSVPGGRWAHCMVSLQNKILMLGGLTTKQFMSSDLYVLETDREVIGGDMKDDAKNTEMAKKAKELVRKEPTLMDLLKV